MITAGPAIDEIRAATNGNYVLGNTRFKEEIAHVLKRPVTKGKAGWPVGGSGGGG